MKDYEEKVSANAILEEQEFDWSNDDYNEILKMCVHCNKNRNKYPGFNDQETYEMMKLNFELFEQFVKENPTDNTA